MKHNLKLELIVIFVVACSCKSQPIATPVATEKPTPTPTATPEIEDTVSDTEKEEELSASDKKIQAAAEKAAAGFNGTYLIARDKTILAKGAAGEAGPGSANELKLDSPFRIGSCTKPFTALAIMQLQEDGKLNVNDSVGKYLTEASGTKVTIHHLLTHSSGLPDYVGMNVNPTSTAELKDITNTMSPKFEPGTKHEYSNTNYAILGFLIEKVSGLEYPQYIKTNLLQKAGMTATGYGIPTGIVLPIDVSFSGKEDPPTKSYAAGAIYSTVRDLHKFALALKQNKFVSNGTFETMTTTHIESSGYGFFMGPGFINHDGIISGYTCSFTYYPKSAVTIAILSNGPIDAPALAERMRALVEQ